MIIRVICTNCGCPLSDKYELYYAMKSKLVPKKSQLDTTSTTIPSEIFDVLKITRPCCKEKFMCNLDINDYY